jgi:hypothetical protein
MGWNLKPQQAIVVDFKSQAHGFIHQLHVDKNLKILKINKLKGAWP